MVPLWWRTSRPDHDLRTQSGLNQEWTAFLSWNFETLTSFDMNDFPVFMFFSVGALDVELRYLPMPRITNTASISHGRFLWLPGLSVDDLNFPEGSDRATRMRLPTPP